jgi:hypothetical protein
MKDNLDLEVTENNSTRPQLDVRLKNLKQNLSERSDKILGIINSIDNDPQFHIIKLDDMEEFNLFNESGGDNPTLHQILQWNNVKNKVNDDYFDKDSILDERWDSEWYDYVGDNYSNYDGESFCFMRDDWKYELQEDEERRMISDWIDV